MVIQSKANILEQRFLICLFAAISAFFGYVALEEGTYDLVTNYIFLAIIIDQLSRLIKPAPIDEVELTEVHKVNAHQLEDYIRSKRNYRILAATFAGVAGISAYFMGYYFSPYFAITCPLVWCFYPLYRMFFLKLPAPKMLKALIVCANNKEEFPNKNSNVASYDHWPSTQSYAMNRITPGTVEWRSNQNRL